MANDDTLLCICHILHSSVGLLEVVQKQMFIVAHACLYWQKNDGPKRIIFFTPCRSDTKEIRWCRILTTPSRTGFEFLKSADFGRRVFAEVQISVGTDFQRYGFSGALIHGCTDFWRYGVLEVRTYILRYGYSKVRISRGMDFRRQEPIDGRVPADTYFPEISIFGETCFQIHASFCWRCCDR